jgi:protein-S-isoprenylcysteine O-methyltransferase Ste14
MDGPGDPGPARAPGGTVEGTAAQGAQARLQARVRARTRARIRARAALGSLAFLLVAPGTVVGLVPWALTGFRAAALPGWWLPGRVLGAVLVVAGLVVLLEQFGRFVLEGLGTPAPVAPTRNLVVGGWYRHVRNPMYVAVITVLAGETLLLGRPVLAGWLLLAGATMVAFVRGYEEPTLLAAYGRRYLLYRERVPGWLPRLRPADLTGINSAEP